MEKIIKVIPGNGAEKVYIYIGKFAPYDVGLTIGEIILGLPDPQTARMCLTDIMATLAERESVEQAGRIAYLPFQSDGLLTVSGGYTTLTGHNPNGETFEVSGKICIFACTKEEAARHDAAATQFLKENGGGGEQWES